MQNASGPGYLLKYTETGEDYIRWDRYNNRGFVHIGFFVFVRIIISCFVYGWMTFQYCCNKKRSKSEKTVPITLENQEKTTGKKADITP